MKACNHAWHSLCCKCLAPCCPTLLLLLPPLLMLSPLLLFAAAVAAAAATMNRDSADRWLLPFDRDYAGVGLFPVREDNSIFVR